MKSILIVFLLAINLQVFAALPPFAESKKEIEAILNSPEIGKYIPSGDVIMGITKTNFGYLIITNNRSVGAIIHYLPQENVGPARFEIEFMTPTELPLESDTFQDYE